MKYRVVLLSGKQGSGKTTLSNTLKKMCPVGYTMCSVKFADVLYEIHDKIWEILNKYDIYNPQVKSGFLLQWIGTEFGRKTLGENVWANICRTKVDQLLELPGRIVVIDDCRFTNEFLAMQTNALTVRLECPEEIRKVRCEAWRENTQHPSEVDLDLYAQERRFDLYVDTQRHSASECAVAVLSALDFEVHRND